MLLLLVGLSLTVSVMAPGCGGHAEDTAPPVEATAAPVPVDTLVVSVTDTIGVEMGDSAYVFGLLMGVGHDFEGNIIALDVHAGRLSVFDPDGEFLKHIGAPGPGPGEFQVPIGFAVFPEGGVAVSDAMARVISFFDGQGVFTGMLDGFFPTPPISIEGAPGEAIIGQHMPMVMTEDMTEMSMNLSRWSGDPEPDLTYLSIPMELDFMGGGNVGVQRGPEFDFAVGPDGSVFVAIISDTVFSVTGFTPEGEEFLALHREMDRVPMTQEEIDAGGLGLSLMVENGDATMDMNRVENTYPWRNVIGSIGIDSRSRIWIELAYTDTPVFEVYDYSGELLFVAEPDVEFPQVGRPAFQVDGGGIIAFDRDPMDYPKIFLFELQEG